MTGDDWEPVNWETATIWEWMAASGIFGWSADERLFWEVTIRGNRPSDAEVARFYYKEDWRAAWRVIKGNRSYRLHDLMEKFLVLAELLDERPPLAPAW